MPALVAICYALASQGTVSVLMACVLLLTCALMQPSVNTFNDYFDYVKGTDSANDNVEIADATLVYNNVNPRSALALAVGMLVCAFALGIYVITQAG